MKLSESRRCLVNLVGPKQTSMNFSSLSSIYASSRDKTRVINVNQGAGIDKVFGELLASYKNQQSSFLTRRTHKNEYILHTQLLWYFSTSDKTIKQALAKQIDISKYELPESVALAYKQDSISYANLTPTAERNVMSALPVGQGSARLSQWLASIGDDVEGLSSESLTKLLNSEYSAVEATPDYQAVLKIKSYVEHLEALPDLPSLLSENKSQRRQMLFLHPDKRKLGALDEKSDHPVVESVRTQLSALYHQRCDAIYNSLSFYNEKHKVLHQARDILLLSPADFLNKFHQHSLGLGSTINDQHFCCAVARLTQGLNEYSTNTQSLVADFILDVLQIEAIKSDDSRGHGLIHKTEGEKTQDFVRHAFSGGELKGVELLRQHSYVTSLDNQGYVDAIIASIQTHWSQADQAISKEAVLDIDVDIVCEALKNYSTNQSALARHYDYQGSDEIKTDYSQSYKHTYFVALQEKLADIIQQDFNPEQLKGMSQNAMEDFQAGFNGFFSQHQEKFSQFPQMMAELTSVKGVIDREVTFKAGKIEAILIVKQQLSELAGAERLGWSANPLRLFSKMPQGIAELKALLDNVSDQQLSEQNVDQLYNDVKAIVDDRLSKSPSFSCFEKPFRRSGEVHALYERAQDALSA